MPAARQYFGALKKKTKSSTSSQNTLVGSAQRTPIQTNNKSNPQNQDLTSWEEENKEDRRPDRLDLEKGSRSRSLPSDCKSPRRAVQPYSSGGRGWSVDRSSVLGIGSEVKVISVPTSPTTPSTPNTDWSGQVSSTYSCEIAGGAKVRLPPKLIASESAP